MQNIEDEISKFLKERGWNNLRPSDLAKSVVIEAAELLEVFQWSNVTIEETKKDERRMAEVKKELADVLIYAIDLAVLLDLDTEKIILDKLQHVKAKYPADLMRKSLDTGAEPGHGKDYIDIKQEYRRKGL